MIFDKVFQTVGRSSMTVSELLTVLGNVQHLCTAAGAKTAVKDLQAFSDMLKPYSQMPVDKACAEIKQSLAQAAERPAKSTKKSAKVSASVNQDLIQQHLGELRAAGTDQNAFDLAFKKLKASKSLKSPDVAEIARQFSLSVTAYKSKPAAYSDIEKAFVREARFENKLR
jgi:hypothetical protein